MTHQIQHQHSMLSFARIRKSSTQEFRRLRSRGVYRQVAIRIIQTDDPTEGSEAQPPPADSAHQRHVSGAEWRGTKLSLPDSRKKISRTETDRSTNFMNTW